MNEFEKNEMNLPEEENIPAENPAEERAFEFEEAEAPSVKERNTEAPSGWTYSANTNQYVSWEGNNVGAQQNWAEPPRQNPETQRQEYGTHYGYYGDAPSQNAYQNNQYKWDFNKYESAEQAPAKKKKSHTGLKVFLAIIGVLLGICIVAVTSIGLYSLVTSAFDTEKFPENYGITSPNEIEESPTETPTLPDLSLQDIPDDGTVATGGKLSATEVYKLASPSVVGIVQYQYSYSFEAAGSGSGIILSEDGYIVTNAHVIEGAETIKVVLYNEKEYEAKLIGSDTQTDIAVIKIEANNLVKAEFADSEQVEIGETVYAIGNPGGLSLQSSFTDGIISGLNRVITTDDSIYSMSVLQTSAAINPGNSGGALVNEYGQVIGITSSKIISTDYEGIGFAIPSATAKPIIEEIMEKGYVSGRAKLGITGTTIDSVTAKYYSVPQGVQIVSIEPGSCLDGTKAQVGDIIIAYNGEEISQMEDLQSFLAESDPGEEVTLTFYRYSATRKNDITFDVTVRLIENKG